MKIGNKDKAELFNAVNSFRADELIERHGAAFVAAKHL